MRTSLNCLLVIPAMAIATVLLAEESAPSLPLTDQLREAQEKLAAQEEHLLRYKFSPGEAIRWKVVHLGTTETTISGNTQTSKSRSVSTKRWEIQEVTGEGHITLSHSVESVDMWQQLSDRPEVSYNSQTDKEAPPEFQQVPQTIGKPLTTVRIRANGEILDKNGDSPSVKLGLGDIVMLLPPNPIRVGSRWFEPTEIRVRQPDGQVQRIKTRKLYTLEKVATGVATISVRTEVLTPASDPRIQAQLVQQLTQGTIKFDIDAGRILAKQMDWDETVVGFNGADSSMKYLARFTEELLPGEATAGRNGLPRPAASPAEPASATRNAGVAGPAPRR